MTAQEKPLPTLDLIEDVKRIVLEHVRPLHLAAVITQSVG